MGSSRSSPRPTSPPMAKKGAVRGMHLQYPPATETKLVRCTCGASFDIIQFQKPHPALLLMLGKGETAPPSRHGMMPCSTRSSSTSLSFSVSIGRQKPSCLNARS